MIGNNDFNYCRNCELKKKKKKKKLLSELWEPIYETIPSYGRPTHCKLKQEVRDNGY
jgi:hypothetical protein